MIIEEIGPRTNIEWLWTLDLIAEVFVQAQEVFRLFDQLMQSAQHRRIVLLREVGYMRKFRSHSDRRATRKR